MKTEKEIIENHNISQRKNVKIVVVDLPRMLKV